jgi:hypothetical protein
MAHGDSRNRTSLCIFKIPVGSSEKVAIVVGTAVVVLGKSSCVRPQLQDGLNNGLRLQQQGLLL